MKKGKKALIISGCVLITVAVAGISIFSALLSRKTPVEHEAFGMDGADKKLAVITDGSEFKTELKDMLLRNANDGLGVEVFGLTDAKKVNSEDYNLVVVIAPTYIGKLQLNAKNYVKKHSDDGNLLLIVTSEGDNEINLGVDTVTMATSSQFTETPEVPMLSIDDVCDMIMEKMN